MTRPERILLTGRPGSGKTTVVLRTVELVDRPTAGFYTEEVREPSGRRRLGFDVCVLGGPRAPLARKGAPGPRVGRYGVDVSSFEETGVRALEDGLKRAGALLVVDELGKMEFFSTRFVELLPRVFGAANPLLGTIMLRRHLVADRYRNSPGVEIIHIDERNRDELPAELAERLRPPPSAARPRPSRPPRSRRD